jgi:hypothetical protein
MLGLVLGFWRRVNRIPVTNAIEFSMLPDLPAAEVVGPFAHMPFIRAVSA